MLVSRWAPSSQRRTATLVAVLAAAVALPAALPQWASAASTTTYLSDLTATGTPVNGWGPYERDMSNGENLAGDGHPLTLGATHYAKGLGVHAASDLRFTVPAGCTFSAQVGVDAETMRRGSVVFEVWNGTTARLYQSPRLDGYSGGQAAVSVPLGAVTSLRLVVTDGGDGNANDHADWADAKVTCAPTATTTAPAPTTTTPAAPAPTSAAPTTTAVTTTNVSDLTPSTTPVNGYGPYERNMSNGESAAGDGHTLTVAGTSYTKGLGVHAASDLRYTVPTGCTFTAQVGVDDETNGNGSVQFEVWNGTAARLYQSPVKHGHDAATAVSVPLTGVTSLRLVVTNGGDNFSYDHGDWANAKITCGGTPTAAATSAPTTSAPTTTAPTTTAPAPTTTTAAPATTSVAPTGTAIAAGPGIPVGDAFFGSTNYYHSLVTSAPLDANSANMVANLNNQVTSLYGGVAAFNAYRYNVSFYTAAANTPLIQVKFQDCQNKGYTPAGLLEQFSNVPMPANAIVSAGTDKSLTIYSPSLNKVWEFWVTDHRADGWYACWGGRMDNVSTTSNPYFLNGFGSTATGLLGAAGAVSIADIRKGSIDHALNVGIPDPAVWTNFSWPAQRSDGGSTAASAIPEGTRLRLDPSINVDALPLHPIAKMIAKAAQKYGIIVTDRAGCVSLIGESGAGIQAVTGSDPWQPLLNGTPDYALLKNFPWSSMQVVQRNWLKP
jgi:hypothetical protein